MRPVSYTFNADEYCEDCTRDTFGVCPCGQIACPGGRDECGDYRAEDDEGNEVGACWGEHPCGLWCGGCGEEIVEPDHSDLDPGDQCECGHVAPDEESDEDEE